jgi:hypothetical protein
MGISIRSRKRSRFPLDVSKAAVGGGIAAAIGVTALVSRRVRSLVAGKSKAAANAVTPSPTPDYDDVTLTRKVETEIFRADDAPKGDVNVNTENGVVYLRGKVKNPEQIRALEVAALEVDGVRAVNNLLTQPGTEPLTKTEGKIRSVANR